MERYHHSKLESPERQIRLLSILPSSHGRPAEYTLETFILNDRKIPYFYAISYEWGPPQPQHSIVVDDRVLRIRSNLRDCLERFASQRESFIRHVWIDAICIDQDDNIERNAQVKMMGSIFHAAKLVMVWLGKPDARSGSLTNAADCLQEWRSSEEFEKLVQNGGRHQSMTSNDQPTLFSLAEPYDSMWSCLQLLCDCGYWKRLWVIQELIKAEKLLLLWGDEQIQWTVLETAFRTLHSVPLGRLSPNGRTTRWSVVASSIAYQVWQQKADITRPRTLLENMEHYQLSNCTDPRDKAYALTGISRDADLLQVDYDKSLPDLYADLMALIIDHDEAIATSHLLLRALRNQSRNVFTDENNLNSLKGRSALCTGRFVGQVVAVTTLESSIRPEMLNTDIFEMLLTASLTVRADEISRIETWAHQFCQAIQREASHDSTPITFFWLSSGQIGASKTTMVAGESVFACLGTSERQKELFIRAENGLELVSPLSGPSSPTLSSPTLATSSSVVSGFSGFSGLSTRKACRVWLSEPSSFPTPTTARLDLELGLEFTQLQISLPELIAMDTSLDIELKLQSTPVDKTPQTIRKASAPKRHTSGTDRRFSDPISDIIDQLVGSSPPGMWKSYTWPSQRDSPIFIDAVARELRDKLFISEDTPLNSPD